MSVTVAQALRAAVEDLRAAGIPDAPADARALLAHVLGLSRGDLILHGADPLDADAGTRFATALAARRARQPVSQITGQRLFWGLPFKVTQATLDPRPETEILVAEALTRPFVKLLDLGTGSGCILLACLKSMPIAVGTGTDVSTQALDVALENSRSLGLSRRARFVSSDWFTQVPGRFDLIVSNPPYIAESEMADLAPEVRDWEPRAALTPGGDGLDAYRRIAAGAGARLMGGGRLLLEIGPTQGIAVSELLAAQGFSDIGILPDLDGRDRVVVARRPASASDCGAM